MAAVTAELSSAQGKLQTLIALTQQRGEKENANDVSKSASVSRE